MKVLKQAPDKVFTLLLQCLKSTTLPNDTIQNILQDEKKLISLSYLHAVFPIVYNKIISSNLNTKNNENLKKLYINHIKTTLMMSSQLTYIIHFLEKNHIKTLSFKGPTLAQIAYKNPNLRQFSDIDILIQRKDCEKMLSLMISQGYIPEIKLDKKIKKTFFYSVNALGFHHPTNHTYIEIHWELFAKNYAITWREEMIWQHSTFMQFNNQEIRILTFEMYLLYLCVHGSKHFFSRLLWLYDIDRLIHSQTNINWNTLIEKSKKYGLFRIFLFSISLAHTFFDTKIPKFILKLASHDTHISVLKKHVINIYLSKQKNEVKTYHTFFLLLQLRERQRDKINFIRHALFATKFNDFKYIQLPYSLSFLYPIVRLLRLSMKYFR